MSEAMKNYPIGTLAQHNYLQSLHIYFAPHAQTQIMNLKSEIWKLLSLTGLCFTCVFALLQHIIWVIKPNEWQQNLKIQTVL